MWGGSLHDARQRSQSLLLHYCNRTLAVFRPPLIGGEGGVRRFPDAEGLGLRLAIALQQDLHPLLRGLERALAVSRQLDTPLEGLQGLIERQVTALQARDQGLELGERPLEIGEWFALGHERVTLYSVAVQVNAIDAPAPGAYSRSPR